MGSHFFKHNENGMVLVVGLMFLALLSLIAATGYVISSQDLFISTNYKYAEQAFNQAEAGIQYGVAKLEIALKSGSSLPTSGTMEIPGALAPLDFLFTLSPLTVEGDNSYSLTSTGRGNKNSTSQIKVGLKRLPAISYGVFGDFMIDSKSHVQYCSYDSRVIIHPTPSDSTGQGDLASNGAIVLNTGTLVDGDVVLGNNRVADASYHPLGSPVVNGENGVHAGRLEPDPMNTGSGNFLLEFDSAALTNDNADITPSISGFALIDPGGTVRFPGKTIGSIYYFERIELSGTDIILIDASNGPVTLYLRGILFTKEDSEIQILGSAGDVTFKITEDPSDPVPAHESIVECFSHSSLNKSGNPTGFTLMTDSDAHVSILDDSQVNALVYAPHAQILLHSSKPLHGAVFGKTIVCEDYSIVYFDTALKDKYLSSDLAVVSWKKVLN